MTRTELIEYLKKKTHTSDSGIRAKKLKSDWPDEFSFFCDLIVDTMRCPWFCECDNHEQKDCPEPENVVEIHIGLTKNAEDFVINSAINGYRFRDDGIGVFGFNAQCFGLSVGDVDGDFEIVLFLDDDMVEHYKVKDDVITGSRMKYGNRDLPFWTMLREKTEWSHC